MRCRSGATESEGARLPAARYGPTVLIASSPAVTLGVTSGARVRFSEQEWERWLWLDDRPTFDVTWCGTYPFLFKRLDGSTTTLSLPELQDRLAEGLDGLDRDVITAFAQLLPRGVYRPMLLRIEPRLIYPGAPGDYFAEEVIATWSDDPPEDPRTPYYRALETVIGPDDHLYEFIVPMLPPDWNDPDRLRENAQLLAKSSRPTAVAVSMLEMHLGEGYAAGHPVPPDDYGHWCLTHFLLDGHHKLEAAAVEQKAVQLLTLLSIDQSRATPERLDQLEEILSREPSYR